jgi:hypothetical protein
LGWNDILTVGTLPALKSSSICTGMDAKWKRLLDTIHAPLQDFLGQLEALALSRSVPWVEQSQLGLWESMRRLRRLSVAIMTHDSTTFGLCEMLRHLPNSLTLLDLSRGRLMRTPQGLESLKDALTEGWPSLVHLQELRMPCLMRRASVSAKQFASDISLLGEEKGVRLKEYKDRRMVDAFM